MSTTIATQAYRAGFGPYMVQVTAPGEKHLDTIEAKDMGKCPGGKRRDGVWFPRAVNASRCESYEQAQQWDADGGNVGLALGREANVIAVDNDINDPVAANAVNVVLFMHFPIWRGVDAPEYHRRLYPARVVGELPKGTTLMYEKDGVIEKIDILSDGKQYVEWGTHSRTGKPYITNVDLFGFMDGVNEFPEVMFTSLPVIIGQIDTVMVGLGYTRVSGSVSAVVSGETSSGKKTATEYELNRWLSLIPNTDTDDQFNDRSQWIGVAHAIHGASEGADWGRELWLMWCNQRNQEPGQPEHAWDTLKGDGRVGLDFIREKARDRDPRLAAQLDFELAPPVDEDYLKQVAAEDAGRALWPKILPRLVWVAAHDRFFDLVTGEKFSCRGIDMKFGHLRDALLREAFPAHTGKKPTFSQMFSDHPDTLKVDNTTYWPGQPRLADDSIGRTLMNGWRAAKFKHAKNVSRNDIQLWLDLVELVVGDKATAELFIKYLALIVKYPGIKPNFAPLIMTIPGIGKDTLLKPILVGVGEGNYAMVSADTLSKDWTPFAEKRFVYMSEMRQHQRGGKSSHDVMNDLKVYLADKPEWVNTHRKGVDEYLVRNNTAWVFFSNETHPLYLAEGDRRLWVIDNMKQVKQTEAYYAKVNDWLDRHGALVASFLQDYPLTAADIQFFKGAAPASAAKDALIAANRDPIASALAEIIDEARNGTSTFPTCLTTSEEIRSELRNRVSSVPGGQIINRHLRALGAKPVTPDAAFMGAGVVPLPGGSKKRLWVLAPTDVNGKDYTALSPAEAGKIYSGQKWPAITPRTTNTGVPLSVVGGDDEI